MNQQPKAAKKPKTKKSKAQIHDLKPKKDAKGGTVLMMVAHIEGQGKQQKAWISTTTGSRRVSIVIVETPQQNHDAYSGNRLRDWLTAVDALSD